MTNRQTREALSRAMEALNLATIELHLLKDHEDLPVSIIADLVWQTTNRGWTHLHEQRKRYPVAPRAEAAETMERR